jgi:uncharacterized membrane protein
MYLSNLFLAPTLIVWAVSLLGWAAVDSKVIGILALVSGILIIIEGLGVYNLNLKRPRE